MSNRIQFGAGQAILNPIGGNLPTLYTPQILLTLQDFSIDISATIKDLRGQYQFPDDTAISDKKIAWKSGSGRFDIDAYNNLFFGETAITTGGAPQSVNEAHTIPSTGPYTVTVTNVADTPLKDLGVLYTATGQKGTRMLTVGAVVAAGEYFFNTSTGAYTFSAADEGLAVQVSYSYTVVTGNILTVQQHVQGYGPSMEIFLALAYNEGGVNGVVNYIHLYNAKVSKLGLPLKRADYLICDIEGEAYANSSGNVMDFYTD